MNAEQWKDLLDGLFYVFAQPVYYGLVLFIATSVLATILLTFMDTIPSRNKDD